MHPHMLLQSFPELEPLPAQFTCKIKITTVYCHVILQYSSACEGLVAHLTLVGSFLGVCSEMDNQTALQLELLIAKLAFKRGFSVSFHVNVQRNLLLERRWTQRTAIRSFFGMNLHVSDQIRFAADFQRANVAFVIFHFVMNNLYVSVDVTCRAELLSAVMTRRWFCSCVDGIMSS